MAFLFTPKTLSENFSAFWLILSLFYEELSCFFETDGKDTPTPFPYQFFFPHFFTEIAHFQPLNLSKNFPFFKFGSQR